MIKKAAQEKTIQEKKTPGKEYLLTVGRRREAVARVRLYPKGTGTITVNNKPADVYFAGEANKVTYMMPFTVTNTIGQFDITIKVAGGGLSEQLGAAVHGIARAIEKFNKEKYRALLKKKGLMTRDPRSKERRKAGFAQKARARKQSPKR